MSFVLPVHATASGGLPNLYPVGSPIAGSPKTGRIHQGFQQQGTIPVEGLPVARHLPRAQRQNFAGQSFDAYPGQNQKSAMVDDRLEVASPLLVVPADPLIPSLHLPGRRRPQQTGQLPPAMTRPVAQVRAERHAASEIVIPFHLLAPAAALRLAFHQHQFQRLALAGGAFHGYRFAVRLRDVCSPPTPPAQVPQTGKLQEAFGLEPLQQLSALVVLQSPTGPFPLQQLADGTRDFSNSEGGKLTRSLAHQLQFARAERASAEGQRFGHAI